MNCFNGDVKVNKTIQEINNIEFKEIINDLLENSTVQEMCIYRQHYNTSCLEHCIHVAYFNYLICKKFGMDYHSAARAGLLHDLFLYDWREKQPNVKQLHAFAHPRIALNNSEKYFELNDKEKDIILKHMWPLTISLPKYKESYVITFVDKYCTLLETWDYYCQKIHKKSAFAYMYIFLCLFIFTRI